MTVLVFLATILVLVGIHELGHFLVARAFGVYVREFAIGIGPLLLSTRRGGTKYSIRLLPIGGYVSMAGEDRRETDEAVRSDQILYNKPPYVRAMISLSGALANIVLAFVVTLAVVWASNLPMIQVADVVPSSPAAVVLQPGDRVIAIDGQTVFALDQITRAIRDSGGSPVEVDLLRGGEPVRLTVAPRYSEADGHYEVGAYFLSITPTNEIASIAATSPLFEAGIRAGDRILSVDDTPVSTAVALLVALDDAFAASEQATLRVARGGEEFAVAVAGQGRTSDEVVADVQFADLGVDVHRPGFIDGLLLGVRQFASYVTLLGQTVRGLVVGAIAPRDALQGPVGIAGILRQGLSLGPLVFLQILAFLSLNFGLINLVPFPALDGSRAAFAVYEWIRGRPIRPEREGIIHAIGFAILIGLMILITYQDIVRLFR